MTWWETEHWKAYERAYGDEPGTRVRELADATWLTHVVDLTQTEEELWRKIPKTMRQAVMKGESAYRVALPVLEFENYMGAHIDANGGEAPRSMKTYFIQEGWVLDRRAMLGLAWECPTPDAGICVGGILVIRDEGWAYYASGPSLQPHVMPALIWAAMKECKLLGDRWFEVGWLKGDTEKERSIAKFKSRWGGENKPANWLALEAACQES